MSFLDCAFGPQLFVEYGDSTEKIFEPNKIESFGDQVLLFFFFMRSVGYYTWPLFAFGLYLKGALVTGNAHLLLKLAMSIGLMTFLAWLIRGFGRFQSKHYIKFINIYRMAKRSEQARKLLKKFDYEFSRVPVDFHANQFSKPVVDVPIKEHHQFRFTRMHSEFLACLTMKTFGISLIYPGSIKALQRYLRPVLISGRTRLVQDDGARRYKIRTSDGNDIDTMFIDNRGRCERGNTLVVCCEGNAGFYEVGILSTPVSLNFSVIGWNHPGFEGSTGTPYPLQERNAIEAIMAFAINQLQFPETNIILYGWSIGGYTALWGACCFNNVKGVVLDAVFDDLLPLALRRVPWIFHTIVEIGVQKYCNLDNMALLTAYDGPISVIRRLKDEIIAEDNKLETNRTNDFILSLLEYRFPNVFTPYQMIRAQFLLTLPLDNKILSKQIEEVNKMRIASYASTNGKSFPLMIGAQYSEDKRTELANYLLIKYAKDVSSTHCAPLLPQYFCLPWDVPVQQGFQKFRFT